MAFTGNTANYTSSAKWSAVTAWSNNGGAGTAYTAGNLRRQTGTPTAGNERVYVALNSGTGGTGADPLTTFTRGVKITDAGVTWQEVTGQPAVNGDLTNTPNWTTGAKSLAVTQGHIIKDDAGTHIFIATTIAGSGTGGGTEPTWNVAAVGNTTVENAGANQITWTYLGTSFGAWAAPHARIFQATQTTWGDITSCRYFVGSDHASTGTTSEALASRGTDALPVYFLCVDVAGSLPPVSADLRDTATVTTTGTAVPNSNGIFVMYGITHIGGTSGGVAMPMNSDNKNKFYENCGFQLGAGTAAGAQITFGSNGAAYTELKNCGFKFTNVGHQMPINGRFIWRDSTTVTAIDTGTVPTALFSASNACDVLIKGVDLSAIAGGKALFPTSQAAIINARVRDCKTASTFLMRSSAIANKTQRDVTTRSDSAGTNYTASASDMDGALTTEATAVRTGGASDGVTGFSWKIVTTANPNPSRPFVSLPFSKWNSTVGSNVVVTVYGIINAAAVPNNGDLWFDVDYLGTAGSPQSKGKSSRVADFLASVAALTADSTSAWDSVATARANTHVYVSGDMIKLASNPGRLFFCTTGGTSNGSEPGGYASAVDGGSVTDNTAVFRAGCRFSMTVTLTSPQPQIAGALHATFRAGKASATYFVDPFINLS